MASDRSTPAGGAAKSARPSRSKRGTAAPAPAAATTAAAAAAASGAAASSSAASSSAASSSTAADQAADLAAHAADSAELAERRRPGRPRKHAAQVQPTLGVVALPHEPGAVAEFWLPSMDFRRLFAFFRGIHADSLLVDCGPDGVNICGRNAEKMRVVFSKPGRDFLRFYAPVRLQFSVNCSDLEKQVALIDRAVQQCRFVLRPRLDDMPQQLEFGLHDLESQIAEKFQITLPVVAPDLRLLEPGPAEPLPVTLRLSSESFKRLSSAVMSVASSAARLSFYRGRLAISSVMASGAATVTHETVFESLAAIQLQTTVAENVLFESQLDRLALRAIAVAVGTDPVTVAVGTAQAVFSSAIGTFAMRAVLDN